MGRGEIQDVDIIKKTGSVMTPADILLSCYKIIKNFSSGGVVDLVYILTHK